ncbi:MAG: alpha/beta hydrolase [Smithellaceae bacterium]|nr:alpha/beta hydrolase [Syntrophaceae bacterium]MDD4240344.1 alpha/beta hydrolase [Smithellaceae bacterium]NLX51838.1 alpha/beta hydrolase [Deltaproteobacteria bacterium]
MDLRERFIETNGVKLHVMEAGPEDGPMILFLHGFPEFWWAWRKQLPYFADKGYRVVAPDQRGYNLSDKPEGVAAYNIDKLAKDMIGLLDAYGQKQVYLVGHDWGASVSWWLALKYPDRFRKLVILNVPHPKIMAKNVFTNTAQMQRSWYIFYFQIPGAVDRLAAAGDYEWVLQLITTSANPGTFSPAELEEYRKAFRQPGAFTAMVNWYRAMIQTQSEPPRSFDVTVPMILMWGEEDVAMLTEMADQSMRYCKEGRLIKLSGVSHWIQHEAADKVNAQIAEFFEQK